MHSQNFKVTLNNIFKSTKSIFNQFIFLLGFLSTVFSVSAQYKTYELLKHYPELGGVLVAYNKDTNKGLVITANDLSQSLSWESAFELNESTLDYDQSAAQFSDWRLPNIEELNTLYTLKDSLGLKPTYYWSASHSNDGGAWEKNFGNGRQVYVAKRVSNVVRTVREVSFDKEEELVLTEG